MWMDLPQVEYCSGLLCSHPPLPHLHQEMKLSFPRAVVYTSESVNLGNSVHTRVARGAFDFTC